MNQPNLRPLTSPSFSRLELVSCPNHRTSSVSIPQCEDSHFYLYTYCRICNEMTDALCFYVCIKITTFVAVIARER